MKGWIYHILLCIHMMLYFLSNNPQCNKSSTALHHFLTCFSLHVCISNALQEAEKKYPISQHLLLIPHWYIAMETRKVWNKGKCAHFSYFSVGTSKFTVILNKLCTICLLKIECKRFFSDFWSCKSQPWHIPPGVSLEVVCEFMQLSVQKLNIWKIVSSFGSGWHRTDWT